MFQRKSHCWWLCTSCHAFIPISNKKGQWIFGNALFCCLYFFLTKISPLEIQHIFSVIQLAVVPLDLCFNFIFMKINVLKWTKIIFISLWKFINILCDLQEKVIFRFLIGLSVVVTIFILFCFVFIFWKLLSQMLEIF